MPLELPVLFGAYELDPGNARLCREGQAITLPPKSFAVLCHLVDRAGQLVSKDELLDAVWGHRYVSEGVLKLCVSELRSVLQDDPKSPRYIETAHRRGYRFIAKVAPLGGSTPERIPDADSCLVGRQAQVRDLHAYWTHASRGERRLVFVTGEPGLGKTSLVAAFAKTIPAGPAVIRGQCVEQSGSTEAYLPLLEALGQLCRDDDRAVACLRRYAPTWLAQMPWLIPENERAELQGSVSGATRERMLREGVEFLEAWSLAAPLLLVLEDLHWSDAATVELLACLARRQTAARLLVVGTYRPVELVLQNHPLKAMQQELRLHRLCAEVPLELLGEADVEAYLRRRLSAQALPESLPQAIYRRTDGQPLFMVNVIEEGLSQGWLLQSPEHVDGLVPQSLRQFIEQRLERLAPGERRVLEAGSVLGAVFNAEAAAAICEEELLPTEECCAGLAQLGRFLQAVDAGQHPERRASGRYAFLHALYRDVLYHRIPPARRRHLHRRAGLVLESALNRRRTQFAPELSLHFESGLEYAKAIQYLMLAAENAARRYANPEAMTYLSRALGLVECLPEEAQSEPRLTLFQQRAAVRRTLNDMRGAIDDLNAMLACSREHRHSAGEVRALIDLSRVYLWVDRRRSLALSAEALECSRRLDDPIVKTLADATHASMGFFLLGWQDHHAETCRNALATARLANDPVFLNTRLSFQTMLEVYSSNYRAASATADEGIRLAESLGDGYLSMVIRYFQSWALLHAGDWGRASSVLAKSLHLAEQNGAVFGWHYLLVVKAMLYCEALDFQGAVRICEAADSLMNREPGFGNGCLFHIVSSKAHLGAGNHRQALSHLTELARLMEDEGLLMEWFFYLPFHHAYAEYWLAQGDREEADRHATRLCELASRPPERTYWALSHCLLARIALSGEDLAEAQARVSEALAIVENAEVPLAKMRVYALAAKLKEQAGREEEARAYREKAACIIRGLAASLDEDDAEGRSLRTAFLNAAPVRQILGAMAAM